MRRLFALLLLCCGMSIAQNVPNGFFAWWDSPLVRDLNLSTEQTARVRDTVREFRNRLIDLRASVRKAELDSVDAFNEENFDSRHALEAMERLNKARHELSRTLAQLSVRLRGVLTAEQWHELQKRRPQAPPPPRAPGGR